MKIFKRILVVALVALSVMAVALPSIAGAAASYMPSGQITLVAGSSNASGWWKRNIDTHKTLYCSITAPSTNKGNLTVTLKYKADETSTPQPAGTYTVSPGQSITVLQPASATTTHASQLQISNFTGTTNDKITYSFYSGS